METYIKNQNLSHYLMREREKKGNREKNKAGKDENRKLDKKTKEKQMLKLILKLEFVTS